MMNTQELKTTVSKLSPDQLLQFAEWFEEFLADQWDKEIEADRATGRLHTLGEHVDSEFLAEQKKRAETTRSGNLANRIQKHFKELDTENIPVPSRHLSRTPPLFGEL